MGTRIIWWILLDTHLCRKASEVSNDLSLSNKARAILLPQLTWIRAEQVLFRGVPENSSAEDSKEQFEHSTAQRDFGRILRKSRNQTRQDVSALLQKFGSSP
jgi:hypothetical protein